VKPMIAPWAQIDIARKAQGLTLKQMADTIGVSETSVQKWKNGGKIAYETLERLAVALHTTAGVLLGAATTVAQHSEKDAISGDRLQSHPPAQCVTLQPCGGYESDDQREEQSRLASVVVMWTQLRSSVRTDQEHFAACVREIKGTTDRYAAWLQKSAGTSGIAGPALGDVSASVTAPIRDPQGVVVGMMYAGQTVVDQGTLDEIRRSRHAKRNPRGAGKEADPATSVPDASERKGE
jgi:transcriptional regulator with XRE-family HTH domain